MKNIVLIVATLLLVGYKVDDKVEKRCVAQPTDIQVVQKGDSRVAVGSAAFSVDGHFVWGASVVDDGGGKYYMVYSAVPAGIAFNDGWVLGSKLGLAVSDSPYGDFKQLGFFYNTDGFSVDSSAWDAQTVSSRGARRRGNREYVAERHPRCLSSRAQPRDLIGPPFLAHPLWYADFTDLTDERREISLGSPF